MNPSPWTPDHLASCLIEAFRAVQGIPIFSPRRNVLQPLIEVHAPIDLVTLSAHYLGRESHHRQHLLAWASAQAGGPSLSQRCHDFGWKRRTVENHVRQALKVFANGLNRDGVQRYGGCQLELDNGKIRDGPMGKEEQTPRGTA